MKRFTVVIFLAFLASILWTLRSEKSEQNDNILLIGNHSEPADLDPQIVTSVPDQKVTLALFEGLVTLDPKNLDIVPGVAERWELSADGLVYTFFLRNNAQWSNGDPITANDFIFSIRRILDPNLGSENAHLIFPIAGAAAFNQGTTESFHEVGIKAIDEYTLEIRLTSPTPYFLHLITHNAWYPVHQRTLERWDATDKRGTPWTHAGNHVGNGSFRLKYWKNNDYIELEKNPHYWGSKDVQLDGLKFFPIEDAYAEERSFKAGQLHLTDSIPSNKADTYIANNDPLFQSHNYLATYYYIINTEHPPLDDSRVRRALSLSIQRDLLAQEVIKRAQAPAYQFTPAGTAGYTNTYKLQESIKDAQRLLAEAGFPNGKDFPALELLFNTSTVNKPVAEAIQAMWKAHLNIEVSLVNQEWKNYLQIRREGAFDIARASWVADFIDPYAFAMVFKSNSGNNYSRWKNANYDRLLSEAELSSDQATRFSKLREAEKILLDESPIIPIYFHNTASLVTPRLHGYYPNLADWHPYQYMSLES